MRVYPDVRTYQQDHFDFFRGENAVDTLLKMPALKGYAQKLQNMEFQRDTLRRRPAFIAKSTLNFSAEGVFQGAHEYITADDAQHILTGHNSGKVKRWASAASSPDVVTGLTVGQRIRFESMNGAAFACNGADTNRRIDGTTARLAGAPAPLGTIGIAKSAGALTGDYQWIVITCIKFGGVVILRSDWSTILQSSLAAQRATLSWTASADTRTSDGFSVVYEVYRSEAGVGDPYFLVAESATNSYEDNTADTALTRTTAEPLRKNGVMPVFKAMAASGYRLAGVKASDPKVVALSNIATTDFEMETFPGDGRHELAAPGNGPITGLLGFGVKDEQDNRLDLFIAQPTSCYVLRGTDPFGSPETLSGEKGVVGFEAVCQWKQYLFFMSNQREIEFYGPSGLVTISDAIDTYMKGGGPLNKNGLQGNTYVQLKVWQNFLLVILRDDSSKTWGNVALCLDLLAFNPLEAKASARWTHWTGPGFGMFLPCRDGELVLLDNQNTRMLKRGTGPYDSVAGVDTRVVGRLWSGAILGEYLTYWKVIYGMNVLSICDADTSGSIESDYGTEREAFTIPQNLSLRDWDKVWDKSWSADVSWSAYVGVSRDMVGRCFQAKILVDNASADYVYIGQNELFDQVENPTLCVR